jgi:hypothetical protein
MWLFTRDYGSIFPPLYPENPNKNRRNPNKKSAKSKLKKQLISEIQMLKEQNPKDKKTSFLFKFFLIIVWNSLFLSLDFLDYFENPGNPNKRLVKFK